MPTASPIIVIIIVTKKSSSKAWPITATAASAMAMATMARPNGSRVAADGAEQRQEDNQRYGDADPFPLLEVFRTQLVVLERYARVAADEHQEVVRLVRLLDLV